MQVFLDFLENAALLSLMGLGVFMVRGLRDRVAGLRIQVLYGLVFGAAAFLVTATPLTLGDGATLDARAGPVVLGAVFGGPVGGLLAAGLGALARGLIGGNFAFSGVIVYFLYAAIGLVLSRLAVLRPATIARPAAIAITVLATCLGASAMFFLISPMDRAMAWLADDLPLIMVANAVSVVVSALVVAMAMYFADKSEEVVELNETLELAKRAGGFGVWDYDLVDGVLRWDARSAELHGLGSAPVVGGFEDWSKTVHPEDLPATRAAFDAALEGRSQYTTEYRVILPDGRERAIKGDAIVLRDRAGAPVRVVGTNLDLTELRTAEARLVEARSMAMQAQKMDTVGQLTGGIAHDFNNLLAVIMGNQELLRDSLDDPGTDPAVQRELIEASLEATKRGAGLTRNLLAYARRAQLSPEVVDLNKVVHETTTWLRRTIESRIEIETVLEAGLWPTLADRVSLQSALVNLLVNARDALDGPGRVTVETSNVRVDADYIAARSERIDAGRYVLLAVSDTGPGIAQDVLDQIFDPFFTTKPVGEGTGLGLSMVQGFVKQSGGTIRVYSEPGVGTSFKLYFPASTDAQGRAEAKGAGGPTAAAPDHRGDRILLVEDQEQLLSVYEKILTGAGYDVVTATSGDAAFEIFKADPGIALVATDIVMPGRLQGPALAREIRKISPDMRFVFFSGYAREAAVHGNGLSPDDIRLMKPVSRRDLLHAIATAL